MTSLGVDWTLIDSDPGRDGWKHYATATDHGDVCVMGSGRAGLWQWRLVAYGEIVARGETERGRDEPIRSVLATCARQAYVASRCAARRAA